MLGGTIIGFLDAHRPEQMLNRFLKSAGVQSWLPFGGDSRAPTVPTDTRVYAIGDVHGRSDLLAATFERIDADLSANPTPRAIHVFLGDYIDRGPDSRGVVDLLLRRKRSHEVVCLKGNHEALLLKLTQDPSAFSLWTENGGLATIRSYGLANLLLEHPEPSGELADSFEAALPAAHRQFFAGLTTSFECGDFFFVHAGIRPGVSLSRQREADLLWIRDEFLAHDKSFGKIIVHGHTPVQQPEIHSNRINIDTGAFTSGRLTCLRLEKDRIEFL